MSYYDNSQWPAAAGQATWDHQTPPARSGASSVVPRDDSTAFASQMEEVDRAVENLFKSGKGFSNASGRRESMPMGGQGRGFSEFDPRVPGGQQQRHHSVSEFGDARSYSGSNLQNFYATQRQQPPRASEAEQVMQAKRRMAAQRERELRNYHQEQQYNRTDVSGLGGKPDRTMSPAGSGMSEDERRELIARQRSALYGEGAAFSENGTPLEEGNRPATQGSAGRGSSPQSSQQSTGAEAAPAQPRSRANSTSSPSSSANPTSFGIFDNAQQSSRTSASSPGGSPPRQGKPVGNVAPIGTRPAGSQAANPALTNTKQRATTPLPSPLSYGYSPSEENAKNNGDRTTSATSNPSTTPEVGLGSWGAKSGVWGKNSLGVQASVWG